MSVGAFEAVGSQALDDYAFEGIVENYDTETVDDAPQEVSQEQPATSEPTALIPESGFSRQHADGSVHEVTDANRAVMECPHLNEIYRNDPAKAYSIVGLAALGASMRQAAMQRAAEQNKPAATGKDHEATTHSTSPAPDEAVKTPVAATPAADKVSAEVITEDILQTTAAVQPTEERPAFRDGLGSQQVNEIISQMEQQFAEAPRQETTTAEITITDAPTEISHHREEEALPSHPLMDDQEVIALSVPIATTETLPEAVPVIESSQENHVTIATPDNGLDVIDIQHIVEQEAEQEAPARIVLSAAALPAESLTPADLTLEEPEYTRTISDEELDEAIDRWIITFNEQQAMSGQGQEEAAPIGDIEMPDNAMAMPLTGTDPEVLQPEVALPEAFFEENLEPTVAPIALLAEHVTQADEEQLTVIETQAQVVKDALITLQALSRPAEVSPVPAHEFTSSAEAMSDDTETETEAEPAKTVEIIAAVTEIITVAVRRMYEAADVEYQEEELQEFVLRLIESVQAGQAIDFGALDASLADRGTHESLQWFMSHIRALKLLDKRWDWRQKIGRLAMLLGGRQAQSDMTAA